MRMNSTRNTINQLQIELGNSIYIIYGSFGNIAWLSHIPDHEALNGLIFGNTTTTICAVSRFNVTTTMLRTAIIPSFFSLKKRWLISLTAAHTFKAMVSASTNYFIGLTIF
jgi:hypothetical protein